MISDFCPQKSPLTPWMDHYEMIDEKSPEHNIDSEQTIDLVRSAIGLLEVEQRKVLTLVDMENFSYREVADILDLKIGTVMSRLSRARTHLREIIIELMARENQLKMQPGLWRVK